MSTMKKKTAPSPVAKERKLASDAYDYHDDVTKEAVAKVRAKAAEQIEKADLELVDGLGRYSV